MNGTNAKNINAIQQIANAALIEQSGKPRYKQGKIAKNLSEGMLIQNIFTPQSSYYYVVSLSEKPVSLKDFKSFDPDIKITKGLYTIQYIPMADCSRNPKFPYLIGQDLVRIRVTVSGPAHWGCLCERIPELKWIKRNSTFTDELFRIAKMHPGLAIRFGIDIPRYCRLIEKKAEEMGIDIDHKPLVCYQWSEKFREENKDKQICPIRTKADYVDVLQEVEHSNTVLKEIEK